MPIPSMSKSNRPSSVLLVCDTCGAKYQAIKPGLRYCDTCGGVLKPQEKQHKPLLEKPK